MNRVRKHSQKRDAVLEKIRSTDTHPSADWVYEQLRSEYPDISLGTVYRNIAMFLDEGQLISIGVINGQERYDANTSEHTHFICEECGRVIDIDGTLDPSINVAIGKRYGFEVRAHSLTFYGKCNECSSKVKQ